MCSPAVLGWIERTLPPDAITGRRVLEVGSCDLNGSPRTWITRHAPASYLGVDAAPGPGVDQQVRCEDLTAVLGVDCADIVVSTEMLEHVGDWPACLHQLVLAVRPGGLLLLTTRSLDFPYHPYPEDWWRFAVAGMRWMLTAAGFHDVQAEPDPVEPGVFAVARKPAGWAWPGPAPAELWADGGVTDVWGRRRPPPPMSAADAWQRAGVVEL